MVEYQKTTKDVALTAVLGTTPEVRFEGIQAAVIVAGAVTITFYGSNSSGGTFRKIQRRTAADTNWTAFEDVTLACGGAGVFPVPDQVLCCPYIKMVLSSGTATVTLMALGTGRHINET